MSIITVECGFVPDVEVVGCYIEHDRHFLMLQKNMHKYYECSWGVPAGKLIVNESLDDGLRREVYEETSIELTGPIWFIDRFLVDHGHIKFAYSAFYCQINGERPNVVISEEHLAFQWVKSSRFLAKNLIPDEEKVFMRLMKFRLNGNH